MNSTNDLDKLKKRQEQLAAWKQKKLAKDEEQKKLERQKRIEEWKRKRLGNESNRTGNGNKTTENADINNSNNSSGSSVSAGNTPEPKGQPKSKPLLTLKKVHHPKENKKLKRSVLNIEDVDNDEVKKPFKKPAILNDQDINSVNNKQDEDEEDIDLDEFINSLNEPNSSDNKAVVEAGDSDSESDLTSDEDDTNNLLSKKLKKLQEREKALDYIDHSKVNYKPFRKNFYKPPLEFENLSPEDIELLRMRLNEIQIKGKECPIPISKWSQLGLSASIMKTITDLKYEKPSPIQGQALPAIMSGRDIIGVAKTGSGKTLAFVLPLIRHIQDQDPLVPGDGPIALILAPTRELSLQINKELNNFTGGGSNGIKSCCCYGGSPIELQIAELKKGVHVIVGTPGRVIDLLTVNSGRVTNLQRVTYLVLDEADRMFDMGFEPQVNKILTQVRPDKQMVLFSATFPKKLENLARRGLHNPLEIIVGNINTVSTEIDQHVELFKDLEGEELNRQKFLKLVDILDEFFKAEPPNSKILIFVEKQDLADQLMIQLISSDYNCISIHGGKEQIDRKYAIKEFSSSGSNLNILIATSIAARGLDVKGLNLVINYDPPNHLEDYIHRVGRTGRAGLKGKAITFITEKNERAITDIVKVIPPPVDPRLVAISEAFLLKVKAGKEKYSFGFGGKGLEKLQQQRENTKDLERKTFGDNNETDVVPSSSTSTSSFKKDGHNQSDETKLPDFEIIEGKAPETSGPDRSKYHSRITINDLPQKVRWYIVNRDSLSKIIDTTSTSITHKGQYYPPNTNPKPNGPSKLYLLVEGLTVQAVEEANHLIKQRMIEGLQMESQAGGKYSV